MEPGRGAPARCASSKISSTFGYHGTHLRAPIARHVLTVEGKLLIWLREPAESKLPERPEAGGKPLEPAEIDHIYADLDARRVEVVGPLVDAVLADVVRFDERAVGLTPTPAIAATLDAKQIGELAGDDRIDMIYDAPVAAADLGIAKHTTGVTQLHGPRHGMGSDSTARRRTPST